LKVACFIGVALTLVAGLYGTTLGGQTLPRGGAALGPSKDVAGHVVVEGGAAPRFGLPITRPGRPVTTIQIDPQADGTFTATLPLGLSVVGAATGLPSGFALKSLMYGATDLTKDALNVGPADTATLVVTLGSPRLGAISGRVTGLKSTEGVRVVLRTPSPGLAWEAPVAPDGSYKLTKVFPGTYSLRVSYAGIVTAKQVVLGNEDLTGVDLEMSKERVLIGHILVETGTPPDLMVQVKPSTGGSSFTSTSALAPQGGRSFFLRIPDGQYSVSIPSPPPGFQVRSISYGTTDLTKEPLQLDGAGIWEIVVWLRPN
jgi:hypothetical protein